MHDKEIGCGYEFDSSDSEQCPVTGFKFHRRRKMSWSAK
jgi:hypothetical protein